MSKYEPCDFEIEVLKECAGLKSEIKGWGAAVGASLESLQGAGFLTRSSTPKPTERGFSFLRKRGYPV